MPLRILLATLIAMLASACAAADADIPAAIAPVVADDTTAVALPSPARLHGNWRLVAADDPHAAALMAFSILADKGDPGGSGDYALFQPFCDVVAGMPIAGDANCELIGLSAPFDGVDIGQDRVVLAFHPTADGNEHRLELRRQGDRLVGDYIAQANDIRRAVIATRPPADTR